MRPAHEHDAPRPGFTDPSHDAQRLFRGVLDAFSHPGRLVELADAPAGPGTLSPAAAAFLLTFADRETPLWLEAGLDKQEVRDFLRFHAGTPIVQAREAATFAVIIAGGGEPSRASPSAPTPIPTAPRRW